MSETAIKHHPDPLCPVHQQDVALIGCPCANVLVRSCQNGNDHPSAQAVIEAENSRSEPMSGDLNPANLEVHCGRALAEHYSDIPWQTFHHEPSVAAVVLDAVPDGWAKIDGEWVLGNGRSTDV